MWYIASTPREPEIKDTTDTVESASYLDIHLEINGKKNYWPNFTTKGMFFHAELATFLSSVATSLPHLRVQFLYHNSYVIPELAITTRTFCIALDVLQLGFWKRVMLWKGWGHHNRSCIVIMNSWIVLVYPFAPWKLICSICHILSFLFRLPKAWLFMMFLEKQRTLTLRMHLVNTPSF